MNKNEVTINRHEINAILEDITPIEAKLLLPLISMCSGSDNVLRTRTGKDAKVSDIARETNQSVRSAEEGVRRLSKRGVVRKVWLGRKRTYYMNPYIATKERKVDERTMDIFSDYEPKAKEQTNGKP